MSRIHEALKKAEEERGRRPLSPPDSQAAELPEVATVAPEEALPKAAEGTGPAIFTEFDDFSDHLTLETLRKQVRKYKWSPNLKTMLFMGGEAYAPGTEEFRTLRSRLYEMRDLQPLRTLLITSASPGEGKSFIAANLAQIFAQQPGKRVLLIDGDIRWSRLHLSLGCPATPGLTEYLRGEVDELGALQAGPLENLLFIPGGKHAPDPAELISNGRLKTLLRRLSPLFDWVILDTPPAMAVSDSRLMAGVCDGVLMVVAAGMESYAAVQKAGEQFKDKRLLGVVLNRAEARHSYSYKYYGYYYGPDKDKKKKGRR